MIKIDVVCEGLFELLILFDYLVMLSLLLSSEILRLDSIDDDSYDDVGLVEVKVKVKVIFKDDDGVVLGDWLVFLEEDVGGVLVVVILSVSASASVKKLFDGVDALFLNFEEDVFVFGDNGVMGD